MLPEKAYHRHGSPAEGFDPTESIPAIGLTEEEFRRRLGELLDDSTVEAVELDFEPRIANTDLGPVLAPRPSR